MYKRQAYYDTGNVEEALKTLGIDAKKAEQYFVEKSLAVVDGKEDEFHARYQGSKKEVELARKVADLERQQQSSQESQYQQQQEYWSNRLSSDADDNKVNDLSTKYCSASLASIPRVFRASSTLPVS